MSFTTACPNCDARLQAPDTLAGKRVKCKKCGETFVARSVGDEDGERASRRRVKSSRMADDSAADEDRPRRRHRDEDTENEPRPRKKKTKKKKAGSPALLVVLLVVGAVVLIGGGIGVYLAFPKEEKPGQLVTKEQAAAAVPVAKGDSRAVVDEGAVNWTEVHEPDGRYRIRFPTAPERETRAGAETTAVMYRSRAGADGFLAVHRLIPPDAQGPGNEDRLIDQFLDLANFPSPVQASDKRDITYQSFKGREVFLEAPGKRGGAAIRVIIAGDRVIGLGVMGDTVSADSPRIKEFFESLKIE